MTLADFEEEMVKAIEVLPEKIKKSINNVVFVVEEEVRPAVFKEQGIKWQGVLLGLYQGVPLSSRGVNYYLALPDKITLFKKTIEELADGREEKIKQIIREVTQHEIAHYFGMNETEVRKWENKRRNNK